MRQKFSFHTHTNFSDGHNTPEEMLQQAQSLGWDEIGISDHLIVNKHMPESPSWSRWSKDKNPNIFHTDFKQAAEDFVRQRDYIRTVAQKYAIKVRIGAEVDFFTYEGWEEGFAWFRERVGLDYYISGNHFIQFDNNQKVIDLKDLSLLDDLERQNALKNHFQTICLAVRSGVFSFIAHIDYIRKTPYCPDHLFIEEKRQLINCLAENHTAAEISTKGLRKRGDFYPADYLLKEMIGRKIPLVISDDAHKIEELGYLFDQAEDHLRDLGCFARWCFK